MRAPFSVHHAAEATARTVGGSEKEVLAKPPRAR